MKQKTALLLFFLALNFLYSPAVSEASGTVVRVDSLYNVQVNSTVAVDIWIENPSQQMAGVQLELLYNEAVVRATSIEIGPLYSGIIAENLNDAHTGKVGFVWAGNPVNDSGIFCTIYFEIRSSGSTGLNLNSVVVARIDGTSLPRTVVNGYITTSSPSPYQLVITSPQTLPARNAGSSYSYTFSGSGGSSPYTWTRLSGILPPGLSLSSSGVLSGTPHQPGAYTFALQLADNAGVFVNKVFNLTITGSGSAITDPVINSPQTLPAGDTGSSYSYNFSASGGSSPYRWTRLSGTLPSGLSLSSNGVLSGTPTVAGAYTFTLRLTDALDRQRDKTFNLLVRGEEYSPVAYESQLFRSIVISHGTLDTRLGPENAPVTLVVDGSMRWLNVSALLARSGDRLRINNESLGSGTVKNVPLNTGHNSINIGIAPHGSSVYQNITITVYRL